MHILCALRIVLLFYLKRHGSPVGPFFKDVVPVLLLTTSDSQSHLPHVLTLRQKSPSDYTKKTRSIDDRGRTP